MRVSRWLRQVINGVHSSPAGARRLAGHPRLEALEDRLAPAVHTWTGVASHSWSNPNNWIGGAPSANESNLQLIFPSGAANLANTNDLNSLNVQSITFASGGYSLSGKTITL